MGLIRVYSDSRNGVVETIQSPELLKEVLDRLQHQRPGKHILVRMLNENDDELMVGLGPQVGLVTLTLASRHVVYNALGAPDFVAKQSVVGFEWGRHWLEMGPENLLPVPVVLRVAEKWVADGSLDDGVKWEACPQRSKG